MNKIIKSLALVGMFAVAPQSLAMPNTVGSDQSIIGTDNTQKISSVDKENEKIISETAIQGSLIKSTFGEIGSNDFTVSASVSNCIADSVGEDILIIRNMV